jgi:hypothetical protein
MVRLHRPRFAGALALAAATAYWSVALPQVAPARPQAAACAAPADLAGPWRALPNTARALHAAQPLGVLAVGSAFIASRYAGPTDSLPAQTVALLHEAWAGRPIELTLRGDPGATTSEMLAVLKRELAAHQPALVLWQTGTLDAARKISPDAFGRALAQGIELARQAGSDIILIDAQYSHVLVARVDLSPYEEQFAKVAAAQDAALFPRYALTRSWVRSGVLDLEQAPRPKRGQAVAELHQCLAQALSQEIFAGVAAGEPAITKSSAVGP